jgi:hypothetical protein
MMDPSARRRAPRVVREEGAVRFLFFLHKKWKGVISVQKSDAEYIGDAGDSRGLQFAA